MCGQVPDSKMRTYMIPSITHKNNYKNPVYALLDFAGESIQCSNVVYEEVARQGGGWLTYSIGDTFATGGLLWTVIEEEEFLIFALKYNHHVTHTFNQKEMDMMVPRIQKVGDRVLPVLTHIALARSLGFIKSLSEFLYITETMDIARIAKSYASVGYLV